MDRDWENVCEREGIFSATLSVEIKRKKIGNEREYFETLNVVSNYLI